MKKVVDFFDEKDDKGKKNTLGNPSNTDVET